MCAAHTVLRLVLSLGLTAALASARQQPPVVYTVRVPEPAKHAALVTLELPTDGAPSIELWMGVWSPGFYHVEDHWKRIEVLAARGHDGAPLVVAAVGDGSWRLDTGGQAQVVVEYRVDGGGRSVTGDLIGEQYGIFNGVASWLTCEACAHRAHEVQLELPACWSDAATGLEAVDGAALRWRAPDYDTLADAPIVAGNLQRFPFAVAGTALELVDFGDVGEWDGAVATAKLQPIIAEHAHFWGGLPFARYEFLNVFGPGGGGLEHLNSTLISADKRGRPDDVGWLQFVSHEFFHAFNVKRLRPVELGPFDYRHPPRTAGLWIAEGLTSYYGELLVTRAGVGTREHWLDSLSAHIRTVQITPGRLRMTLEEASLEVWTRSMSGVMGDRARTISYYEKGPVAGFLLDAAIRASTDDARSLDDVMRLTFARHGGAVGYTEAQWEAAASEVAGVDLGAWFTRVLRSTDELDHQPALDWFGLRFAPPGDDGRSSWKLEVRDDATDAQQRHLAKWLAPTPTPTPEKQR